MRHPRSIVQMPLGIFARHFPRPTVEQVFHAVERHGLRCVQFNFSCAGLPSRPEVLPPELLDRIRCAAEEHRIEIAAVSATFNMIHPQASHRREGLRRLGVIAAGCQRLGTSVITLCSGTRDPEDPWRHHPDNDSPAAWRDLLVTTTKALTTADKHGLTLGVEPETGNVIQSARHARRLLDELKSPRLKIVIDAANLLRPADFPRQQEILDEAFDLLGQDLVLAHAKEFSADASAPPTALGTGLLDWDRYLSLLQRVRFGGPLILHGFQENQATASLNFLRNKIGPPPPR